jgi:enoyl-CoA hydratase/carnithine racemase
MELTSPPAPLLADAESASATASGGGAPSGDAPGGVAHAGASANGASQRDARAGDALAATTAERIGAAAIVTVPVRLDADTVERVIADLVAAFAGPAPVIALRGETAETFCIGLAIGTVAEKGSSTHAFANLLTMLHDAPKPLLAVVDGRAIGGGLGLACACDQVVATTRATFGLPELLWGVIPAIIWPVVTDRMAPHVARQWTLTAHTRNADEAFAAGVVDELVRAERLEHAARRAVRSLTRLEPEALRRLRQWSRASRMMPMPAALAAGADITTAMVRRPEVQRRWRAFLEGEAPWSE